MSNVMLRMSRQRLEDHSPLTSQPSHPNEPPPSPPVSPETTVHLTFEEEPEPWFAIQCRRHYKVMFFALLLLSSLLIGLVVIVYYHLHVLPASPLLVSTVVRRPVTAATKAGEWDAGPASTTTRHRIEHPVPLDNDEDRSDPMDGATDREKNFTTDRRTPVTEATPNMTAECENASSVLIPTLRTTARNTVVADPVVTSWWTESANRGVTADHHRPNVDPINSTGELHNELIGPFPFTGFLPTELGHHADVNHNLVDGRQVQRNETVNSTTESDSNATAGIDDPVTSVVTNNLDNLSPRPVLHVEELQTTTPNATVGEERNVSRSFNVTNEPEVSWNATGGNATQHDVVHQDILAFNDTEQHGFESNVTGSETEEVFNATAVRVETGYDVGDDGGSLNETTDRILVSPRNDARGDVTDGSLLLQDVPTFFRNDTAKGDEVDKILRTFDHWNIAKDVNLTRDTVDGNVTSD